MVTQRPDRLPQQFGRYRISRLLGEGGMGAVYLAHDTHLDREVALKVPQLVDDSEPQFLDRFYQEARAAATVHHPNICPVFDVDEIDGIPFLTMAFIEGKPLTDWVRQGKPLTLRQIAALVRKVALALHEAHQKGVIHRDLKPANIMIDKRGEPIVMDFGLARRTRKDDTRLTQNGTMMGSPAYMSPEQVKGDINLMGPRCDIYSLGVILYELITGRHPFTGDNMAILAQVLMDEPPAPSTFRADLDPLLESICLNAMAKSVEERTSSMADFGRYLQNYLRGGTPPPQPAPQFTTPASAEAPTLAPTPAPKPAPKPTRTPAPKRAEQVSPVLEADDLGGTRSIFQATRQDQAPAKPERPVGRQPRRNKQRERSPWPWIAGGGGAALVLLLLVVGLVIIVNGGGKPNPTVTVEPSPGSSNPDPLAGTINDKADLGVKQTTPPRTPVIDNPARLLTPGHRGPATAVGFSPDGRTLASVGEDGRLILWDWQKQQQLKDFNKEAQAPIIHVTISTHKDGPPRYVIATAQRKGRLPWGQALLWDSVSGLIKPPYTEHTDDVNAVLVSPHGLTLASASNDHNVIARDGLSGNVVRYRMPLSAVSLAFSSDSKTLFCGGGDWNNNRTMGRVVAWRLDTNKVVWEKGGTFGGIWGLALSRGGVTLVGACLDDTVRRWKADTGEELPSFTGHKDKVLGVAYSPSGRSLASSSSDGTALLRDSKTGDLKTTLKHPSGVTRLAFSPNGKYLATGCDDGNIRIWDIEEYDRR